MNPPQSFIKRYRRPTERAAALRHYRWLASLGAGVSFPALLSCTDTMLEFERVAGHTASMVDVPMVATALGDLHRAARDRELAHATNNARHTTASGIVLDAFADPRRSRLHASLQQVGSSLDSPLTHAAVDHWLDHAATLPAALYKDANPRNVLLRPHRGPVLVDFDSLTLAPVGYDLAKLLVTTAMTDGPLPRSIASEAIEAYRRYVEPNLAGCSWSEVIVWSEFHHLLTRGYLGRHGYQHPWPAIRPWSAKEVHDAVNSVAAERSAAHAD